jgi:sulfide:quinone oxidoreductase
LKALWRWPSTCGPGKAAARRERRRKPDQVSGCPLEFLMLADWYFHEQGSRDRIELIYATPLPGAFTKPIASRHLGDILQQKSIKVATEFQIERVDPDAKKIVSYDEQEIEYDLLVSVPLNMGDALIARSGLGDELNYIPVDKHTFLSPKH